MLGLMYFVFAIGTLIYNRDYSVKEWMQIAVYYGILATILFTINLIKKRWIKWVILMVLLTLLSIVFFGGADNWDYSSLYGVLIMAPVNIPFLPDIFLKYELKDTAIFYLLYFLLPIIYWYGLYIFSKRIVAKTDKNKKA